MRLYKKIPLIISCMVLALAFYIKRQEYPVIEQISMKLFDSFQNYKPREYTPLPVKIIDIDEESLKRLGQWPWPRSILAELIQRLNQMQAAAIGLDIVFSESDRTSPENISALWQNQLSPKQKSLIKELPDPDNIFGKTIAESNISSGFALVQHPTESKPSRPAGISFAGRNPKNHLAHFMGAITNIPEIEGKANGSGSLNIIPDYDGVARRMSLFHVMNDEIYPSFTPEVLRIAQGAGSYVIKTSGASGEEDFGIDSGVTAVKVGQFIVPTDANGAFWLYYTGKRDERYIPAWKILENKITEDQIAGNILLLGSTASILKDFISTPYDFTSSGVEVHAQAIEQIMLGQYLQRPDWITGMESLIMLGVGLLLIPIMLKLPALWGVLFSISSLAVANGFAWYSFDTKGLLVDSIYPSIAILLLYMTGSLSRYLISEKRRKQIRNAFSHYMSPQMVEQLIRNPDKLKLGGEMKELTILFCDIRGFTTISEHFDAEGLTQFINRFLTPMTTIIMNNHGTIDKYMGDCIMAFWNAPLDDTKHANHACISAISMLEALDKLNHDMKQEAEDRGNKFFPVEVGIGMNTGVCCVGNMGSDQRFDYSVIGDDVNLSSRLEGQSKAYGVTTIISEQTAKYVRNMALIELDIIKVKGKNQISRIFALLGDESLADSSEFIQFKEDFNQMLSFYRAKNWPKALEALSKSKNSSKPILSLNKSSLFKVYESRIKQYTHKKLPKNWDGVFVADSK